MVKAKFKNVRFRLLVERCAVFVFVGVLFGNLCVNGFAENSDRLTSQRPVLGPSTSELTKKIAKKVALPENPFLKGVQIQEFGDSAVFQIFVNTPEEQNADVVLSADSTKVNIIFGKVYKTERPKILLGSGTFVKKVILKEDEFATESLNLKPPFYAVGEAVIVFSFPVDFEVVPGPGFLTVTFNLSQEKLKNSREEKQERFELIQSREESMDTPGKILGPTFQAQQDFQLWGRQLEGMRAIDDLAYRLQKQEEKLYLEGDVSEEMFDEWYEYKLKESSPLSKEYWKRRVAASISSRNYYTTNYQGQGNRDRKPDDAIVTEPGGAIYFRRPGVAQVSLGYDISKEFPFMNRVKPKDGTMQQTLRAGLVYLPKKRYSFSWQGNARYSSNLTDSGTFTGVDEDRKEVNWQTALGFNYRLSRNDEWRTGVGMSGTADISKSDLGLDSNDIYGYVSTGLKHSFVPRFAGTLGFSYSRTLRDRVKTTEGETVATNTNGKNIFQTLVGCEYKWGKDLITIAPNASWVVVDSESVAGPAGEVNFRYNITPRTHLSFLLSSYIVRNNIYSMGGRGGYIQTFTRVIDGETVEAIKVLRTSNIGLSFEHQLTKLINVGLSANYSKSVPEKGLSLSTSETSIEDDESDRFALNALIRRQLFKNRGAAELKYEFQYWKQKGSDGSIGGTNNNADSSQNYSSREHRVTLRFVFYLGGGA